MPESSVKIKLGIELDKSELGQQIQEMQKELEQYKLKIGITTEPVEGESEQGDSQKPKQGTSFESSTDEGIDFGSLSDLANDKFNQVTDGFGIVNEDLNNIFDEVKDINSTLKGIFPRESKADKQEGSTPSTTSDGIDKLTNIGDKLLDQLIGLSDLVAGIAKTLENEKKPAANDPPGTEGEKKTQESKSNQSADDVKKQSTDDKQNPAIQEAIAGFNQLVESFGNPGEAIQEIVGIATDAAEQLIDETVGVLTDLGENVVKIVTDLLGDSLENIQGEVLKILDSALQGVISKILDNLKDKGQQGQTKDDESDLASNISGAVSSAASSIIGVVSRLQDSVFDLLGQIAGQLLPDIIKQLEFDFFKSLIGGAVEKIGSSIIAQPAGGVAKLTEGVITGNLFRGKTAGEGGNAFDSADPATEATRLFGEGFAAADPTLFGNELKKLQASIENSRQGTLTPELVDSVDDQTETVRMTAVLEDIAGAIDSSNKILATIQGEVETIGFEVPTSPLLLEEASPLIQESSGAEINFAEIAKLINPQIGNVSPDIDLEQVAKNFGQAAKDVFNSVNVSLAKVLDAGKLPSLDVDTENKYGGRSNYDRQSNKITVGEDTAKALGDSGGLTKDAFLVIARELRAALQTSFGSTPIKDAARKADRGADLGTGRNKLPISKQKDLEDRTKLADVKSRASERNLSNIPQLSKGMSALNIDAEVFSQNLADRLYAPPIDGPGIPPIQELFRADDASDFTDIVPLIQEIVTDVNDLTVLSRESIQGGRSNLDRLSGDSLIDDSINQLGDNQGGTNFDKISGKFKQVVDIFGGNLSSLLKTISVNAGAPNTRWVDKLNVIGANLQGFGKILEVVNPSLSSSFKTLIQSITKDGADLLVGGTAAIAAKGKGLANSATDKIVQATQSEEFGALVGDAAIAVQELKARVLDFLAPNVEKAKEIGGNALNSAKDKAGQLRDIAGDVIDPRLLSFLEGFSQRLNTLGSSLLAGIGQLVVALKSSVANSETIPAAETFFSGVEQELKSASEKLGVDSLFRSDSQPADIWNVQPGSPDYPLGTDGDIMLPNSKRDTKSDIPDPWESQIRPISELLPPEVQERKDGKLAERKDADATPSKFDLATFLQKALPVAIAGLVAAKLGTSLVNNVLPGKKNIEREIKVNDLQSVLTKALVGAVTVALGQKLLPKLSGVFNPDKSVGMSDRFKSIFTQKPETPVTTNPVLETPVFPDLERLSPINELFRGVGGVNAERLDDKQSDLPKIIAIAVGAVLAKNLVGTFIKSAIKGEPRQDSLVEKTFKGLAGLLVGNFSARGKSIDNQLDKSPLNITKDDSLIRKIFNSVLNTSIIGQGNKVLGREPFGSRGKGRNESSTDVIAPGLFESLFSKLPVVLAALIIGGLLAQFIPKLLAGLNKEVKPSPVNQLINPPDLGSFDGSEAPSIMEVENAAKLAKEVANKSGLPKKERDALEEKLTKDYSTDKDGVRFDQILAQSGSKDAVDMEALTANFNKIAAEVFAVSGLNPEKVAMANLVPTPVIDTENKLKGSSSYSPNENRINLSSQVAQGLTSSDGVSREDFVVIAHELRHAMQLAFGKKDIPTAAKSAMTGEPLPVGRGSTIDLKKESSLLDQSKVPQVLDQVDSSLNMVNTGNLTEGIKALELDAEVFAQNLADIFYGIESKLTKELPRANNAKIPSDDGLTSSIDAGTESVESLEKFLVEFLKKSRQNPVGRDSKQVVNKQSTQTENIELVIQKPSVLENNAIAEPSNVAVPDVNLPTIDPEINIDVDRLQSESINGEESGVLVKLQNFLMVIKAGIERIIPLLEQIAVNVGSTLEANAIADDNVQSVDALFRGVPNQKSDRKEKQEEDEVTKTKAVKIGESIGNKLVAGIENVQGRLNKKMQDAGMNEDDIRGLTDQAGGYLFANLSAFFPAGAIGVALAPVVASLSALGIPIAAAVNQLAPLGQMLADTMRTMNPIQTRFETIGGSPEKGEELLTFAETIAQDLNTPLLASIEGFSRLTAASKGSKLEGKDTEELFIGVSQAMAALGLNAQDASLIFLAFQQVISKGKVAAEELRGQIGERLPGAIQLAAKSMGMSVVDFGKQLDLGQINANILLPKFAEALQEEYGAGAEAASKSFLGTLNKIENSLFNFRRLFANEFGGIVAGIARVAATALDLIIKFIDNVILKSGLMFNAIIGIQAQIIAGTAFIFSKLDIPLALAKALSGGYGKMYLVLFPFVFGLFQEIIGTVLAKVFGIEIAGAVEMISGFFSQVVGRVIQTVIDVGKDPKQIFEGLVNLARSVGIGVVTASTAFVNLAASIREQFGLATETMGFFITKLAQAEKLINKIADSTIGRIYAPQVESADGVKAPEQQRGGMLGDLTSAFNGKAIARASLEFFGLFVIMIQTMVLLRIMGEQVLKMGGAFKVFGAEFAKALISLKTGKSILSMLTLGFTGFNLVLAGLVTLLALMVFKSDSVNTFLSELSNSVKDLETLNANLDTLTNRKINITTRITQLDDEGLRETPFQDKGLTLSFWRAREQEQITTDDIIRRIQKRIDDNAYRRDLPLLPENFNENQGSMVDADNIQSLGNNLSSFTGRVNPPESFTELVEFRQKLIKERAGIEEDLTMRLKLDSTNIYDELNRLQIELGKVDSSLGEIDVKQANLDSPANFNPFDLQKSKTPAIDLVKIMRAIVSPLAGSGMSGQAPVVVTNALLGAEKIDLTEQEILLNQQKKVLEAQIAAYERQADLAPGGTLIIEENSLESYASQLRESLAQVNDELELAQQKQGLSPIALPSLLETRQPGEISLTGGVEAAQDFERLTEVDSLQRQQQSLTDTLALLDKAFNVSTEQLDREIKQRKDLINRLQNPANNVGRTGQEQNQQEITTLQKEVVGIEAQKQAVQAAPARDELKRINQDLRALDIFAKMPGVFNNAFTQDDTAIREIVIQQLDVFSTVQDDRINVQRLDEGNLVRLLPQIIDDVATKQKDFSIQRQSLIDEIAQLDLTSEGAQTKLARFNEELKDLDKQLLGLKGLDIFLGVAQSYADLGAGKQSLDQGKITRSLSALAQDLATSPIQSEASQQFQQTPTLPNLAQVEQSILIDLVPARQAVTRAQSERQNILDSPVLRSENDLRRAGFVSKEKKGELDLLEAREKRLSDAIAQTRSAVTDAYEVYNEAAIDGLDFQPALDGYYAVQEELKVLTGQLQDLRNERDKVLDEVKELAPPIQVDDTARQQRLDSVDRAITDAEGRVNELLKQFQLIQETKSGLGGLGQLGEGLELAADKLREEPKGFFNKLRENIAKNVTPLGLPSRESRAVEFESRAQLLTPALGTVSSFVAQQQDLSPIAKKALAGGINSGNFSLTKQTLESIEIKDGKVYFGGEELDGTNKEINAFVDALKTATKILNLVGGDSNKGSKPVQEALAEGLGIETKNTEREAISNRYLQQIAALSTKGVFSESQLNELTKGGVKLADAEKIIGDVRNQDGSTNFQVVIERLQAQGLSEGDIRDVINDLGKLEQVFVDALALDPKGAAKVRLGTIGEEEYTQTVGKLDQISGLARESSMKLGLQYYNGDLAEFETAIKDVKPEFLANIEQLRNLESELEVLGNQRLLLAEQLKRTDLTKEERGQIEKDSERLDDSFKAKYREKQVAGEDLSAANDLVKGVDKALTALEEKIEDSGLANSIKKTLLGQIKTVRDEDITPALDFFSKQEELMVASGEEAVEAANKAITKAMENFEKTVLIIDSTASKKLSDITTTLREFSNNTAFAVTDLSKAVAGLPGDPVRLRAEKELAATSVSEAQAKEKLDAAQLTKDDTDKELNRIEREAAFFSPIPALAAVEIGKNAQREAQNILSEANNEYSAALAAKTEAQLALLDVKASAPVRISQINSRGISNARKQQQVNGGISREEADRLQLNDEIGLIDIELASTEVRLATISKKLQEGLIKDVGVANGKIEELVNTQQDLISARLDKILEKENQQREKSIKLLENQTNLSAKYFDVAINGYEALNKASEQFSKQLDNLTKVGEELKNLAGIEFQSRIGLSENKTNLIDTSRGIADNLASGDLSPQQQRFQQRRLAGIQQLGNQQYGINPSAFSSNEDAALAEQQKIATQLAKDKMEALEKEQAIAAKLLAIEIKRNEIAAQMAVKEAEIGQLRAEQAAIQAQLALRQATIETANSEDKTPVLLAELELAIANSQLGLAGEEVDVAKQSQALQDLFANLQKQSADATAESSRDDLITEIAGNENVDVSQLITALNNFRDFDPNSVNPREVFAPYLEWIESQTPQRNPNTPIGLPLEQFNGDIQAWIDGNIAIAKQEQANLKPPAEIKALDDLFNQVFGEAVGDKISMSNRPGGDIGQELEIIAAARLGEKVAPTQAMIESVSGQREIENALDQGRRLAQETDPIDGTRMASDIYSMSTDMADMISEILVVQKLLGKIASESTLGTNQATPAATESVEDLMKKIDIASGFRDVLAPIVGDEKSKDLPQIPTLQPLPSNSSLKLDPSEFLKPPSFSDDFELPSANPLTRELDGILDPTLPDVPSLPTEFNSSSAGAVKEYANGSTIIGRSKYVPSTSGVGSLEQKTGDIGSRNALMNNPLNNLTKPVTQVASNIFNPTIQNRINPNYTPPSINVAAQQRDPNYFYRNLASEVRPRIDYRVPSGVQQANEEVASNPARSAPTTINITNKIDANSQREIYQKIGDIQAQAIISALGNLA